MFPPVPVSGGRQSWHAQLCRGNQSKRVSLRRGPTTYSQQLYCLIITPNVHSLSPKSQNTFGLDHSCQELLQLLRPTWGNIWRPVVYSHFPEKLPIFWMRHQALACSFIKWRKCTRKISKTCSWTSVWFCAQESGWVWTDLLLMAAAFL